MSLYTQEKLEYENAVCQSYESRDARRYIWLRQLNPRQFAELHRLNIAGYNFDDMVDSHIKAGTHP